MQNQNNSYTKFVQYGVLILSGMMSCLFSENTTAVVVTIAFLQLVYTMVRKIKLNPSQFVYLASVLFGAFFMLIIPIITATSQKMDHYRGFEISVSRIIASFAKFSEVLCNLTVVIVGVSIALVYLCLKQTNINSRTKALLVSYFIGFALFSTVFSDFEVRDVYISRMNFVSMLSVVLYLIFAVWVIFSIVKKELCIKLIFFGIVLASSVAPMMIVTQYGYRTYYITMLLLVVFLLYVLELISHEKVFTDISSKLNSVRTYSFISSGVVLSLLGIFCFVQSVYNFDFFIIRTDMIQAQIEENKEKEIDNYIEVFTLPCEGISIEDEYVNLVFDIIDSGRPAKMKTVGILDCPASDEVLAILESNFFANFKYAFEHLEYRDALIFSNLQIKV